MVIEFYPYKNVHIYSQLHFCDVLTCWPSMFYSRVHYTHSWLLATASVQSIMDIIWTFPKVRSLMYNVIWIFLTYNEIICSFHHLKTSCKITWILLHYKFQFICKKFITILYTITARLENLVWNQSLDYGKLMSVQLTLMSYV